MISPKRVLRVSTWPVDLWDCCLAAEVAFLLKFFFYKKVLPEIVLLIILNLVEVNLKKPLLWVLLSGFTGISSKDNSFATTISTKLSN